MPKGKYHSGQVPFSVGLSSFEVRVYEMQQLSASLLFCLCLVRRGRPMESCCLVLSPLGQQCIHI